MRNPLKSKARTSNSDDLSGTPCSSGSLCLSRFEDDVWSTNITSEKFRDTSEDVAANQRQRKVMQSNSSCNFDED